MAWWETLVTSLLSVSVGAFLSFVFHRIGVRKGKAEATENETQNAVADILAEVESNERISKEAWTGRLIPFVTDAWNTHKGKLGRLSKESREDLYQLYLEIYRANSIVKYDLYKLSHGSGYMDEKYKESRAKIEVKSKAAKESLGKLEKPVH